MHVQYYKTRRRFYTFLYRIYNFVTLVFSVGGGSLKELDESRDEFSDKTYPHKSMEEIIAFCEENNLNLYQYVLKYEGKEILDYLKEILSSMFNAINRGLFTNGILPGGLNVERKSASVYSEYLKKEQIEMKKQLSNGETSLMYYNDNILSDGFYLLDEPENCLSPIYQFKLAQLILDASKYENCQFVIATHSPFFLSIPGAKVYNLDKTPVVEEKWYELENIRLYYEFFNNYKDKFEEEPNEFLSDDQFDELIDYLVDNDFSDRTISIIRGDETLVTKAYKFIKKHPFTDELSLKKNLSI